MVDDALISTLLHCIKQETSPPSHDGGSIIDAHHKKSYYIIPKNMLGRDIFIRATEIRGISNIIRMPSGDIKPIKVPVSKNMLDSHLQGNLGRTFRTMVTVIILDAQVGFIFLSFFNRSCFTYFNNSPKTSFEKKRAKHL